MFFMFWISFFIEDEINMTDSDDDPEESDSDDDALAGAAGDSSNAGMCQLSCCFNISKK